MSSAETPETLMARRLERDTVTVILTDLVTELVGDDGDGHEQTDDGSGGCAVCTALDRAEARLREVTGGE